MTFGSPQNICWSFTAKQRCSILLENWSRVVDEQLKKWLHTARPAKSKSTEAPRSQTDFKKDIIYILGFQLSSRSEDFGVNNIFSNEFGISGPQETWITLDELYGAISYFQLCSLLKQVPIYFSCRGEGRLQQCSAAKLQKYSADYKTSPDFPSAWGWVDGSWTFISGWTYPLRVKTSNPWKCILWCDRCFSFKFTPLAEIRKAATL